MTGPADAREKRLRNKLIPLGRALAAINRREGAGPVVSAHLEVFGRLNLDPIRMSGWTTRAWLRFIDAMMLRLKDSQTSTALEARIVLLAIRDVLSRG